MSWNLLQFSFKNALLVYRTQNETASAFFSLFFFADFLFTSNERNIHFPVFIAKLAHFSVLIQQCMLHLLPFRCYCVVGEIKSTRIEERYTQVVFIFVILIGCWLSVHVNCSFLSYAHSTHVQVRPNITHTQPSIS